MADKKIRCCSCRGFFYYPPWWSILAAVGLALSSVLFLITSKRAANNTEQILDLLDYSKDGSVSVDSIMLVFNGSWIATLAYAGTVLLGLFIAVLVRIHQKIVKQYEFGMDRKFSKRYKLGQLLVCVAVIIALLGVLWLCFLVAISTLWLFTYDVIIASTENLVPTSTPDQCSSNSCLDLTKYPFFNGTVCECNPDTLKQINSLAEDSRTDLILSLTGACGLFVSSLWSLVVLASSLAMITKARAQMEDRQERYLAGHAASGSSQPHDEEAVPLKPPSDQFVAASH